MMKKRCCRSPIEKNPAIHLIFICNQTINHEKSGSTGQQLSSKHQEKSRKLLTIAQKLFSLI
jgi:hypothetical protein